MSRGPRGATGALHSCWDPSLRRSGAHSDRAPRVHFDPDYNKGHRVTKGKSTSYFVCLWARLPPYRLRNRFQIRGSQWRLPSGPDVVQTLAAVYARELRCLSESIVYGSRGLGRHGLDICTWRTRHLWRRYWLYTPSKHLRRRRFTTVVALALFKEQLVRKQQPPFLLDFRHLPQILFAIVV